MTKQTRGYRYNKDDLVPPTKKKAVNRGKSNIKLVSDEVFSAIALILLAGFAYEGIRGLVEASDAIKAIIGMIVVLLLLKTAVKR